MSPLAQVKYRRRSGWLPYVELALGTYFLVAVGFAIDTYNLLAVPFLILFVGGFYWAGITTLHDEHQGRLRWQREREAGRGVHRHFARASTMVASSKGGAPPVQRARSCRTIYSNLQNFLLEKNILF